MATKLEEYVREYVDLVPYTFCNHIINTFEVEDEKLEVDREHRPKWQEFNISQRYNTDQQWGEIQNQIQKYFIDAVKLYMDDLQCGYDFPAKYCFEEYRIKKYRMHTDDQFMDHVDVQDYQSARRFLVVMLYLNSVETGGETHFPLLDKTIKPETGKILVFPSTWQWRHAGRPVISNNKYILGSYLHYL